MESVAAAGIAELRTDMPSRGGKARLVQGDPLDRAKQVFECAEAVLQELGAGFTEQVLQAALAIEFRERGVPYLGLCLGLQCAVVEFARNVCGLEEANSSEWNPETPHPVIDLLPEQKGVVDLGGSMRLGAYPCNLVPGTLARSAYAEDVVYERHRHRYEVNPEYHEILQRNGMVLSGMSPSGRLVEIIELPSHPYFIAGQFHPELRSRPTRPHPLFRDFIGAALAHRQGTLRGEPLAITG